MPIDLSCETVLTLSRAAKQLPTLRGSRPPHLATLYRWAQEGCRGVRLETLRVGGTLCTSVEAIQRFCNALSKADAAADVFERVRTTSASDRAADALAARGV